MVEGVQQGPVLVETFFLSLPTRRDGSVWTQSNYGLTPYWAARVKKTFGKNTDVDAFNRVPGMAQAPCWVSPLEDFFSTPAILSILYWMCPSYQASPSPCHKPQTYM